MYVHLRPNLCDGVLPASRFPENPVFPTHFGSIAARCMGRESGIIALGELLRNRLRSIIRAKSKRDRSGEGLQ